MSNYDLTTTDGVLAWARSGGVTTVRLPGIQLNGVDDSETATYLARAVRCLQLVEKWAELHPNSSSYEDTARIADGFLRSAAKEQTQ